MKKKLLAVLLVLVMLLGMIPPTVFAADGSDVVAKIGDNTFTDLQEAFDAAQEGDTVELTADVKLSEKTIVSHTGTFDLGGHTLEPAHIYDGSTRAFDVRSSELLLTNGNITIEDDDAGDEYFQIWPNTTLTFENVSISITNAGTWTWPMINFGTLILGEGTDFSVSAVGAAAAAIIPAGGSTVIIDGGTISSKTTSGDSYGIYMSSGGTIEFNSGSIIGNSKTKGIYVATDNNEAVLDMNGGTISGCDTGVLLGGESVFNMSDGTIENSTHGVHVNDKTVFNMTGGAINNVANYGIMGNGFDNSQYTTVNIGGNAKIASDYLAIYQPQNGEINISGNAYLKGDSAIGIKSGTLNIDGGTLHATDDYDPEPGVRGNGIIPDGSTIVIDNQDNANVDDHYYGRIKVNISGGELISDCGHNVSVTRATEDTPPVVTVTGGTFKSAENTFRRTETNNAENAIIKASGGTVLKNGAADLSVEFKDDDHTDAGYLATDYLTVDRATGEIHNIQANIVDSFGGTVTVKPAALSADNDTFTLTATPQSADYTFVSLTVTDADGKSITVSADGTQTGDGNDCITVTGSDGEYTVSSHCDITVTSVFVVGENNAVIEPPVISVDTSNVEGIEDEHLEDTSVTLPQEELENILNEASGNISADEARQALEEAGIIASGSDDEVYLQIATEIKVVVLAYDDKPNTPNILQLEITPYYHVFATTSPTTPVIIGEEKGEDFVLLDSSEYRISGTNLNIPMTIPLTESFAGEGALISIEHEHTDYNDNVHHYFSSARVKEDGTITFRNRHGFSIFTFTVDTTAGLDDLQVRDASTGTELVYPLDPEFDTDVLEYEVKVPNYVSEVQVQPTVDVEDLVITVNGVVVTSGDWSGNIPLEVGKNVITVKVSDGDDESSLYDNVYTIIIYRAAPNTPENPGVVEEPEEPDNPDNPDNPDKPDSPEKPETPEAPESPSTSDKTDTPNGSHNSPQTGDNSHLGMWLTLLFLSAAGMLVVVFFNRKRKSLGR